MTNEKTKQSEEFPIYCTRAKRVCAFQPVNFVGGGARAAGGTIRLARLFCAHAAQHTRRLISTCLKYQTGALIVVDRRHRTCFTGNPRDFYLAICTSRAGVLARALLSGVQYYIGIVALYSASCRIIEWRFCY